MKRGGSSKGAGVDLGADSRLGNNRECLSWTVIHKARPAADRFGEAQKEEAMKLKVLIYAAEEGGFWAKVPAIPGCVSQGETLAEVKANILDALEGCLAVREEMELQEANAVEEMEV